MQSSTMAPWNYEGCTILAEPVVGASSSAARDLLSCCTTFYQEIPRSRNHPHPRLVLWILSECHGLTGLAIVMELFTTQSRVIGIFNRRLDPPITKLRYQVL